MIATPNQLAETLTRRIMGGEIAPGEKLLESSLAADLGVSRNTLREAFRMLARDGLVVHIPHRGVFVKMLSPTEVVELFAYRRFIELGALQYFGMDPTRTQKALHGMSVAIDKAFEAAKVHNWSEVGNQNNQFHFSLVSLAGVPRLHENLNWAMAHARLAFMSVGSSEDVHAPFLHRNQSILQDLMDSRIEAATAALSRYLQESEARILAEMSLGG